MNDEKTISFPDGGMIASGPAGDVTHQLITDLRARVRELEERCNRYRGTLDNEMCLGMKYYDKYNALRDAAQKYLTARRKECTHGHPAAAWGDGLMCHECMAGWEKAWAPLVEMLDKISEDGGDETTPD